MPDIPERLSAALEGRYTVEREIGAGGMATVYLAHDVRHDRRVAVKVLRPELAAIMGADRFLSEIRTTANLQHPHILPLFDSGEADGFLFFVMPYVEGETLRDRMEREKQLPVEDAVRIGGAIASALDYAHRQGVIHRDIKPANILLHDDEPLVSDFGIALAVQEAGGGRLTETGLSLGTPHYMSPEQATADRDPDARADVYSLGCVMYEMLTGEPPFAGRTAQAVLGKIITATPTRPTEHRKTIPPYLEAVILKALEKVPADRFETAAAFGEALTNPAIGRALLAEAKESGGTLAANARTVPVLATVAILLAVLAAWGWLRPTRTPDVAPSRYMVGLNDRSQPLGWGTIARDGSAVAYFGSTDTGEVLFVKTRDNPEGVAVRGGPDSQAWVAFSPDASAIVIKDRRSVRTMPVAGGSPTILRPAGIGGPVIWLDDGSIVTADTVLLRIPETGGAPEVIPRERQEPVSWLDPLPDGRGFLMVESGSGTSVVSVYDARRASFRELTTDAVGAWFVAPNIVVVARTSGVETSLLAARLDMKSLELDGTFVPLPEPVVMADARVANLLLSRSGTLIRGGAASAGSGALAELSWVDRDGNRTPADTAWRFPVPFVNGALRLSPDGTRVAISLTEETGSTNVFVKRIPGGAAQKVTFVSTIARRPSWTPDGSGILYITTDGEKESLFQVRADGIGSPTELASEKRAIFEGLMSPDGRWIVYRTDDELGAEGNGDILGLERGQDVAVPLAATPAEETTPAVSPNGRWLAYASTESGEEKNIFVRPFPDAEGGRWQISVGGGTEPAWSRDGSQIFYWNRTEMKAARVVADSTFRLLDNATLFTARFPVYQNEDGRWYDVAPDGRFLMLTPLRESADGRVVVVDHFDEVIRRALPR